MGFFVCPERREHEQDKSTWSYQDIKTAYGIQVKQLMSLLEQVPDDYEVIFELTERADGESKTSIAFINGFRVEDEYREVRLMNWLAVNVNENIKTVAALIGCGYGFLFFLLKNKWIGYIINVK